jgi:8-oxo-dGTP pyrophosphatase MutT (NUDIX family)
MSDAKIKSFLPTTSESKKSGPVKDMVSMYASGVPQTIVSPEPTHKAVCGRLNPASEMLTPTGQGRIKAPPVCMAPTLKRQASSTLDLNTFGVCYSPKEAEFCAEKALILYGNFDNGYRASNPVEVMPLNIDKCLGFLPKSSAESMADIETSHFLLASGENKAHELMSSSSSIVSTSSCGRSATDEETIAVNSMAVQKDPPLEVVSASSSAILENDYLLGNGGNVSAKGEQAHFISEHGASTGTAKRLQKSPLATSLATFTSNLIKGNSSRQGRSLQRWLVHSPDDELVKQAAGTIPITRDGRIILISASRKIEWILPKGGWDVDETKEECAMRETYEEGGLVGQLGGCLEPIDYQTAKSKKRALKELGTSGDSYMDFKAGGEMEGLRLQLPKRPKIELSYSPTGLESTLSLGKRIVSSDSTLSSSARDVNCKTATTPTVAPTVSFDPIDHSYIRLFLFPLYVSSVKSEWPEKGRLRKLVHIDEAIKIMDSQNRPYFRMGLELVKERGLHLLMKSQQLDE